jgi:uncharacterized membrane protein YraQ (UPF0718 family)
MGHVLVVLGSSRPGCVCSSVTLVRAVDRSDLNPDVRREFCVAANRIIYCSFPAAWRMYVIFDIKWWQLTTGYSACVAVLFGISCAFNKYTMKSDLGIHRRLFDSIDIELFETSGNGNH